MTAPAEPVVAVVGAGISGLAAAWRLASAPGRRRVVLLEASGRTGGALQRVRVGAGASAVVVDGGAEALLARRTEAVRLAAEVGLSGDLVAPATARAAVASRGALHPVPPGTVMGVPREADALRGLLDAGEVERARCEVPGPPVDDDAAVGAWVAHRFGPAVAQRLVDPLLGGVYAGRADLLSLRATAPALWPAARDARPVLTGGSAPPAGGDPDGGGGLGSGAGTAAGGAVFAGVRGGVGRLAEALTAALPRAGVALRLGAPVRELVPAGGAWRLRGAPPGRAEEELLADAVVVALPPPAASALLAGPVPEAAAALSGVPTASLALCTLVLPPGALDAVAIEGAPGPLSGVLVPPVEGRLVKAMTFSSAKWAWVAQAAGGRSVLRLSVGRYGDDGVLARSDEQLLAAAAADAQEVLGVPLRPLAAAVTRWDDALPQYLVGHVGRVEAVRAAVAARPGLAVAGAAYDGVGVPACIASAGLAAERVLAHLAA
ncbi:protoporphyrinogen oxidase [Quadrisphaera sp. DSM 44207]|uniref:protoporphyrinogen oxidase n=1 Tax=Quadrisphaera sp. DSM 44207 TaxID=1881057 RepID=UPI00088AB090|nr:protoporphyrinogen oxidase [Quadrisphaera sp. DSM 44207]SDQ49450.1 oxygen-dependent protoporphyrinogen oxidase [Quadrisphaera sp. DSM 44207]